MEPLLLLSQSAHELTRLKGRDVDTLLDGRMSQDVQPCFKTTIILLRFLSIRVFIDFPRTKWYVNVKYVTFGFFTSHLA